MKRIFLMSAVVALLGLASCQQPKETADISATDKPLSVDYEKYTLDNGLDVILHKDTSDPIVAVAILIHAGSNRETPDRTGFAHFFEHMLFQRSENLPQGAFFNEINNLGGTFNGGTWTDGTIYYEVVPNDALERILWMESDRMGYFINSVTEMSLEGEKPVVQNEKRQRYDNVAYGNAGAVINKALYPENHPYNWLTIGELEDLQNATLEDVKQFYEQYYGPNNATLVVAGNFDEGQTRDWIKKYFGEIPSRGVDEPMDPMPVSLDSTINLYYEDNFANLPELRITWPTVEMYHEDQWALDVLGEILSDGKRAPLYKVLVEQKNLAPQPYAYNNSNELAGTFVIQVRANQGVDLDEVKAGIEQALDSFEVNGATEADLNRIKAGLETDFYNGISSVLGKAFQLAQYNTYAGSPDFVTEDIENIKKVTAEDLNRVYDKYITGKPAVILSVVPKGQEELALEGAQQADVAEEQIKPYEPKTLAEQTDDYPRTPSSFDRSIQPGLGELPLLAQPHIWTAELKNGLDLYGIEMNELPLVSFSIRIKGGKSVDNPEKMGTAYMITDLMMEGTQNRTPEELQDAIGQLGTDIHMYTSDEFIEISANCLRRNYDSTLALVKEILLEPRWDEKEFKRIKQATINRIQQRNSNAEAMAGMVFDRMLYGANALGMPSAGTEESINAITIEDLKNYYARYFSPSVAAFHVTGAISESEAKASIASLENDWAAREVSLPNFDTPAVPTEPQVYFVDMPSAKQSVITIGRLTVDGADPEAYPLYVANYNLGGGSAGRLFQVLREDKGYTYGAYSYTNMMANAKSIWAASAGVRSNVTLESLETFQDVIGNYAATYDEEDLDKTKTALVRQNTRKFETIGSLRSILETISTYGLPQDYISQRQETLENMSVEDVKRLVNKYMDLNNQTYVVVGDRATQFPRLTSGSFKNAKLVDIQGNVLDASTTTMPN